MKAQNTQLKVSPETSSLLFSLKHIEAAKEHLFDVIGELSDEQETAFETAAGVVEKQLIDNIRTWVMTTTEGAAI